MYLYASLVARNVKVFRRIEARRRDDEGEKKED